VQYFLDTEFIEAGAGQPIHLLSIALVTLHGREYYTENADHSPVPPGDWVREHVLPRLGQVKPKPLYRIAREIEEFCNPVVYGKPEFWGYYADYDWVVFCQLFGSMIQLPKNYPMYCRDIKQWCDSLGNPKLPEIGKDEHHALSDARWNREAWLFLERRASQKEDHS
jgi:hypothetical protein